MSKQQNKAIKNITGLIKPYGWPAGGGSEQLLPPNVLTKKREQEVQSGRSWQQQIAVLHVNLL